VEVAELSPAAAAALLTPRMGPAEAARLAARAGGRPLLLDELARAAAESGPTDAHPDLDTLIDSRLQRLPGDERLVFALVALAGGPVGSAALRVVGVPHALGAVTGLLSARLLRLEPGPRHVGVVPAHLQFGERCAAQLAPEERRRLHGALAEALTASDDPRLDLVATHLELAGHPERAADVALRAAAAAREAFAYRAAAEAYERAFRLNPALATPERFAALAEVLAALGLGGRAAERFLAAAGGPDGDAALVLRAAEQLLKSAKAEAGYALLARVLRDRGFSPPSSRWGLLTGIAWNHVRLALGLHPPPAVELTAEALLVAAAGLSPIDALASHWFGTHYVLGAGEGAPAFRRTHAAALEAILLARFGGAWLGRRSTLRLDEAFARAAADADLGAMAYAWVAAGSLYWTRQDVRRTLEACENALAIYATITHRSVHWERSVARLWHFGALSLAGDTARVLRLADEVAHDAELREDAWALNSGLFGAVSRAAVIRGDYARAEAVIQAMARRSEGSRGYVGAVLVDEAEADVALAQGDIAGAWAALARGRPARKHHGVEVIPALAISYYSRRAALAAAVAAGRGGLPEAQRVIAQRIAKHDLRAIRTSKAVNAPEIAAVLEAHASLLHGAPRAQWEAPLQRAEAASEANGHGHWAAAARAVRRAAEGVRDPAWCGGRYVDLFLPGLVPPAPEGVAFEG
jgi:tetratricopeptide (TPR) repeat protein